MNGANVFHHFKGHHVYCGNSRDLLKLIPENSVDVIVTSPPYWGQRTSEGVGVEGDPRLYLKSLQIIFQECLRVLKPTGVLWLNVGDAYNTPVNWRSTDHQYSSLGADGTGLAPSNSAYTKNREKRKAHLDKQVPWLKYGNLLALPYRLVLAMCDDGFFFRGEIIWKKHNPLPEGRCRRPHRVHESIYLFAKQENHHFCVEPSIKSVWEIPSEGRKKSLDHFSKFPEELPRRCILSSGVLLNPETIILDPFAGSGTAGVVAKKLNCSFLGFEINPLHAQNARRRIEATSHETSSDACCPNL